MFIVCKIEKFTFELSPNQPWQLPPLKIETKMAGFLPVYATKEEALADYPGAELLEIISKEEAKSLMKN